MKKDIEWIKNKLFEVAWEENKSQYLITLESVCEVIDQLDEPEVLSQEWIDNHKESRINNLRKRTTSDVVPVDDLQNLIVPNQEPEVTSDEAFEKISELYSMTKEEIWRHLEQISAYGGRVTYGEPEVLSKEWIDGKTFVVTDSDGNDYAVVAHSSLQSLIIPKQEITEEQVMNWLDKNDFYDHITAETVLERAVDKGELSYYGTKYSVIETPTIPKYVAEFLELVRSDVSLMLILEVASTRRERSKWEKEYDWISENSETFARAWLSGYEVEEEPLYYALIKGHELVNDEGEWSIKYWNLWMSEGCVFPSDQFTDFNDFSTTMSKSEWSKWGINDSNADFIKVKEVEE